MPTLTPQPPRQKLLAVLLSLLLRNPLTLLPIGNDLERDTAGVEQETDDIGQEERISKKAGGEGVES